jgi:hypothetical protein
MIYDASPVSQLSDLAAVICKRLNTKSRCFYLNSPMMVAGIRYYLTARGLDVRRAEENGSLVLSSSQAHLIGGRFDVDSMISLLDTAVNQALADGYLGLFATGDMTWEFGNDGNFGKIREYETRLEEFFARTPSLSGICQYHRSTLPASAIQEALHTHRTVYVSEALSRVNSYYAPMA